MSTTKQAIIWKIGETPFWMKDRLDQLARDGEPPVLCLESDMALDGTYASQALIVTGERVITIDPERDEPICEVALREVALVKVKWTMGNGFLLLTTWNKNVEAVRFSSSCSKAVEEFKEELDQFVMAQLAWGHPEQNEEKVEHRDDEEDTADAAEKARRCPKCAQLLPRDRDICGACLDKKAVITRMLGFLAPYQPQVAASMGLSLVTAAIWCTLPRLSRVLIDGAIGESNMSLLLVVVVSLASLLFMRAVVAAIHRLVTAKLAQNVIYDLREAVYTHLQRLSMAFHDRQSTGRLISRVTSDTASLQQFAVGQVQQFVVDLLMLGILLIWMMSFSFKLTIMLWFPLPAFFLLVKWYHGNVHKVYRKAFRKRAAMSGHLADTIPGIETVKAFAQEDRAIAEFNRHSNGYRSELIKATHFSARFVLGFMLLTQLGTVLVYWFGGRGTILGTGFSLGDLVMFIGWIGLMYAPVWRFATITEMFENASTAAERVFDVLDTEAVIGLNNDGPQVTGVDESIRFEGVSFNYDSGPAVLKDVSFEVKAGETIGIVGPSGSGKTTLMKLLCRFYDPSKGNILVDGVDLADADLESFRSQLAVVGQNPVLFRETILENIRYGRPDAAPQEVIQAAMTANAHEFIMQFPEAYDTDAREQGSRFSGGERQRICIARAVLKDPRLLVLDEATSAVDTKNEQLIQSALDELIKDRTTFIIAHRLSTLRNADRIIMMKDGRILDFASHDEMMVRCKPYRELVEAQGDIGSGKKISAA